MTDTIADPCVADIPPPANAPILDPRLGDFENDHSATKQRSLLAIAGSLLGEISLPKLAFSWVVQILLPAVLLGLAPLILTAWVSEASGRLAEATGVGAALVALAVFVVARFGWRPLFRLTEFELLVLERARGAARLRLLAGTDPARRGALSPGADRDGACAHARGELRGGRRAAVRRRRARRGARLAGDTLVRLGRRRPRAASPDRADDRQRDRPDVGLSRGRRARLGLCRRHGRPAARPCRVRRPAARRARLAGRASLGHPHRRRALRLSHRERPRRPLRQRPAASGSRPSRRGPRRSGRSISCSSPGT